MGARHGRRFLLEVLYLLGLAAALAFSDLHAYVIVAAMAVGWLLVAGIEWAAFRNLPHFAAGEPPRWRMPRIELPPPRPLEQLAPAYPGAPRDEAVTWIASAELREELLGEWPVASVPEDTQEASPGEWLAPQPERVDTAAEPDPEPEPEPGAASAPSAEAPEPGPVEPVSAPGAEVTEPGPVGTLSSPVPAPAPVEAASEPPPARHHLDPLAEPERRGLRRRVVESAFVEVPRRPAGRRPLPGAARGGEERT
jgi:hypothetical protein